MLQGPLGSLFDSSQLLTDVSGSGNNWAHGHHLYGPQYADELLESIRRPAEECDSLQSFLLLHSLGGGTGSGLGCYILRLLEVTGASTDLQPLPVCAAHLRPPSNQRGRQEEISPSRRVRVCAALWVLLPRGQAG